MDILRPELKQEKKRKKIYIAVAIFVLLAAATYILARLEPAAPTVERGTVWIGKVERGEMLRQVRGSGTLVPQEVRWIAAQTNGRVDRRVQEPGAVVAADSVILELSNPVLEQETLDAESRAKITDAELVNLQAQLESQAMSLRSEVARVDSESVQASMQAEANQELSKDGLVSNVELKLSRSRADAAATRAEIERQRLTLFANAIQAQLGAKRTEVDQRKALFALQTRLRDGLRVRAGIAGVLQEVSVEVGQQVTPGTNLAKVAEPSRLMARVRIPATQARDVTLGLPVAVDTRNGIVPGKVQRIDPAVREGTVTVDVTLSGELPRGARPDLNVDATIEIEHLNDIIYVGRPAFGQESSTVGLFRLESDGVHARRVQVKLGRSSVNTVEVLGGLNPGDEVVLSDTSRWDEYDRIKLK